MFWASPTCRPRKSIPVLRALSVVRNRRSGVAGRCRALRGLENKKRSMLVRPPVPVSISDSSPDPVAAREEEPAEPARAAVWTLVALSAEPGRAGVPGRETVPVPAPLTAPRVEIPSCWEGDEGREPRPLDENLSDIVPKCIPRHINTA